MADDVVRDIPEEMVEAALLGAMGFDAVQDDDRPKNDAYFVAQMRAALSAALAGRTVLELPEPVRQNPPAWEAPEDAHPYWRVDPDIDDTGTFVAVQLGNRTYVDSGDAVRLGLALIAAGREAERYAADGASGSGVGDQRD